MTISVARSSANILVRRTDDAGNKTDGAFDLNGKLVWGLDSGFTPNDVLFMAWRQKQPASWSQSKCVDEWVKSGKPAPTNSEVLE